MLETTYVNLSAWAMGYPCDEALDAREQVMCEVKTIFKDKWIFQDLYDFNVRSEFLVKEEFCQRLCSRICSMSTERAQIEALVNMNRWVDYLYDELQEWVDSPDLVRRWYEDKFPNDAYKGNMKRKPRYD